MTATQLELGTLEQLEFARVLEYISGLASSSLGVEHVMGLFPTDDIEALRREAAMVSELRGILERGEDLPLNGIWDVREALSIARIPGAMLGADNLLHIASTIAAVRGVRDFLLRRREALPLLAELVNDVHANRLIEKHITEAIDETGNIRDNATRELARIRRDIIDRSAALRARLQKILRRVSDEELVTDEYITLREGRLVLPVRSEAKRKIPGIIHGESHSGGTVFLEPAEIFDMNNEISELTFAERREIERILRSLTEEVGADAPLFIEGVRILQHIDSIWARSRYAHRHGCSEPELTDRDEIVLYDARHPILLLRLNHVVPMSIELDASRRGVIVSGPNAGGKTVAMKTLGLITALALSGIHPPASRCRVHPCRVYTDIGDQQSVENDLSTFSSHMSRISSILREARTGDIVLLDEIGTGTDPDEGGAIAASIIDHFLARKVFVMATTHHSYLKVYAYETEGVDNAGMEFDTATITPTYRFILGIPGNSYAFELLDRLGIDDSVLKSARERLGDERNRMTEIIAELERALSEARAVRDEGRSVKAEAERLREKHDEMARQILEQRKGIIEEARREATHLISSVNSQIENALREIRAGASNDRVKELRKQVQDVRREVETSLADQTESSSMPSFEVGDSVSIRGGTQVGEVVTAPDEKGHVVVQFGAVRMRANVGELERLSGRDARRKSAASGRISVNNAGDVETRIDLRGMYPEEAEVRLEQAITAAMNANLTQIDIIHGKGTGVLRKRVHEFLKNHPGVATLRLGALTEGGAGITIVELH